MTKRPVDFGPFGTGVSPQRRRPMFIRLAIYLAIFAFAIALAFEFHGNLGIFGGLLERDPPEIVIKDLPAGLGLQPATLRIDVRAPEAGLDEVIVRLEQADRVINLLQKKYPVRLTKDTIELPLDGRLLALNEGDVTLTIAAFDHSFWSNQQRLIYDLKVDFHPPNVEVIPESHDIAVGGAELVFYKLHDSGGHEESESFSGIRVGPELFPGFHAKEFDPDFAPFNDLFCVFFPMSANFDRASGQIDVFGRDAVGNMGDARVNFHLTQTAGNRVNVSVPGAQLETKLVSLLADYQTHSNRNTTVYPQETPRSRADRFRELDTDYRGLIEQRLKSLFARPKAAKFWEGAFSRFAGKPIASFADEISFESEGSLIGTHLQTGVEIKLDQGAVVRAASSGIVIFADDLGVFGKTVIIDHGFGLTSLYYHLESFSRLEGDRIHQGDSIGKVGDTGLVFSPMLGFEVRLHGIPVRPARMVRRAVDG